MGASKGQSEGFSSSGTKRNVTVKCTVLLLLVYHLPGFILEEKKTSIETDARLGGFRLTSTLNRKRRRFHRVFILVLLSCLVSFDELMVSECKEHHCLTLALL